MLATRSAVLLSAFALAPIYSLAQPSDQVSLTATQLVSPTAPSNIFDSTDPLAMSSQQSVSSSSPSSHSFWDSLSRHWTEADSTKQTFMAILLIIQLVALFCFIKGSLDKIFGRRAEYRNQRTKRFARRAAVAAAGGSFKSGIPLSHQRPLYRPDTKPQLPPRPSQDHPLLRPSTSTSQSTFQTTPTGDIILPSWTESGPTPLKVIVEEPEDDISRSNSPLHSRPHSPIYYRDSPHSPVPPVHHETHQYSWSFRSTSPRDSTSLRLRERNDFAMLPFAIDRSSTPDTRLEDVKRPFNRPIYSDDCSSHHPSTASFADPLSAQSSSPA
ncbi:uncharacterized protein UTRI_02733 [Ustilago trichophora]|uniref:Uncharacterized protein n=1 Tax=Ustilago trichophora TaxID=86804 RepID=A0A5C3EQW4_9BASI|nr:uncharacterized protein UTRI_02733 [Ustilago trichophora]